MTDGLITQVQTAIETAMIPEFFCNTQCWHFVQLLMEINWKQKLAECILMQIQTCYGIFN